MLRIVDKYEGLVIQKRTTPKGKTLGFQLVPLALIGTAEAVQMFATLSDARYAGGFPSSRLLVGKTTAPKSSYPQNTKGYRAENRRYA